MRLPIFSGKGVFLAVCLGKIFPIKTWKGGVFEPVSRDVGYFSEASRETQIRGYDLYIAKTGFPSLQ